METQKIDRRRHYLIVLDTETANSLDDPLVYDIGWAVVDTHGNIYRTRSFINWDIFDYETDLMKSSYYADKLPKYYEDIQNGKRTKASFSGIRRALLKDIRDYNIKEIAAHNARFDYKALSTTQRYLTKSKYRYFIPYEIEIWDTLKMSNDILGNMPTYKKWCQANGYIYGKDRCRMTAEIIYRFISKKENFIESHTGLEDVLIEKEILAYCYRQHKKMRKKLWENP